MTEQDPLVRNANFSEVNLGLPEKVALLEAERCLFCKDPKCVQGCPVGVNIPRFIELLSQGKVPEAAQCMLEDNALPAITGRVCRRRRSARSSASAATRGCRWPLATSNGLSATGRAGPARSRRCTLPRPAQKSGRGGSGPGGLTAAGELAKRGHAVTVFEALHKPGGCWCTASRNSAA